MQPPTHPTDDDFWHLRALLRTISLLADHRGVHWPVQRLDYWRWHVLENVHSLSPDDLIWLWKEGGEILAAMTCEDPGEAHVHIHPRVASSTLLEAMVDHAERHYAQQQPDGSRTLTLWARADDRERYTLYTQRGYVRGDWPEVQWTRPLGTRALDTSLPVLAPPAGYHIRSLGDESELPARSWLSWRAFHPDEPDTAYQGWEWYRVIQRMPLYRRDLDLVAVDDAGTMAAFCTVWYDDSTRTGYFEPVGVEPNHQRRGLGRVLLGEGLRRLQTLGGTMGMVSGYSEAANALYGSVFGGSPTRYERWRRSLPPANTTI